MLISNGQTLNILLANNNKLLNDVLKQTDSKSLESFLKQDSSASSSSVDASKILKEVFDSIKDGTKSNSTLENMLKNSNVFKELGNVSSNLANLLENIKDDESLQKFKPLLENFLKNLKDMDSNSLKEQLKNSGVFLENKLTQNTNVKLENVLQNISNLIKNIDTPQAKEINTLLNNIIKDISNPNFANSSQMQDSLKNLTSSLQNLNNSLNTPLTQNLTNVLNELKNLLTQGSLVESKIENSINKQASLEVKNSINLQVKELLTQVKNDIVQNPTLLQTKDILPLVDNLLKMGDLFSKPDSILNNSSNTNISNFANNLSTNLTPLLDTLKQSLQSINPQNMEMQNHINSLIKKVENIIQEQLNNPIENTKSNLKFEDDFKSILLKMQDDVSSKADLKSQESLKTINNLLTQIDFHQLSSIVSNSNFVYIPFFWEMLEDGSIEMKQKDEEKFFCQIKLTLKDFGKVDLMLSLYDENKIDMTIYAQREHFKIALKENLQKLKIALNSVDLIPVNIKLLDMKEDEKELVVPSTIYQNHYNLDSSSSRVDIKA